MNMSVWKTGVEQRVGQWRRAGGHCDSVTNAVLDENAEQSSGFGNGEDNILDKALRKAFRETCRHLQQKNNDVGQASRWRCGSIP